MIEGGNRVPPGEACEYFGRLAKVNGYAEGTTRVPNYIPGGPGGAITGQQCIDGTFTTLLVARPDLSEDNVELGQRMLEVLDALS